jgi:hypothetical protein
MPAFQIPLTLKINLEAGEPAVSVEVDKAVWDVAYVNDLPDSAFLFVESGDKDEEGKTKPRSLRHFPYRGKDGKVDLAHLRNAIARIPQSNAPELTPEKKKAIQEKARRLLEQAQKTEKGERTSFEAQGRIIKDEESAGPLRYVLNVVLEPQSPGATVDTQKDFYSPEDIWEARRSYMERRQLGLMHRSAAKGVALLDNWITPVDFEFGGQPVSKGTWLIGVEIDESDPDGAVLWQGIKSGDVNAFSIGGTGERIPLE